MSYKSTHTGPQIDAGINAALNPDLAPTTDSDALITSGGVAEALANIDTEITPDTDTTINGLFKGNGSKVAQAVGDTDYATPAAVTATRQMLAPILADPAGQAVSAGDFFIYNGVLRKALQAITSAMTAATFTGATYSEAVSNGGLNELKSAITPVRTTLTYDNVDFHLSKEGSLYAITCDHPTAVSFSTSWTDIGSIPSSMKPNGNVYVNVATLTGIIITFRILPELNILMMASQPNSIWAQFSGFGFD